jgi:hypothetical protein
MRLIGALVLFGISIYPFGVRMTEFRYSAPVYPFALLLAILMIAHVWDRSRWRLKPVRG